MYTKGTNSDEAPECGCGKGKMKLRCAGEAAINAGRYYYKCPANGKHPGYFKWCDEVHGDSGKRVDSVRSVTQNDGLDFDRGCGRCCGRNSLHPITAKLLICFMGLILVLLGVLIGKML